MVIQLVGFIGIYYRGIDIGRETITRTVTRINRNVWRPQTWEDIGGIGNIRGYFIEDFLDKYRSNSIRICYNSSGHITLIGWREIGE